MPDSASHVFRVHIAASIETVWHEFTRTDEPILAFYNNRMDYRRQAPGERYAMRSPNGKWTGVVGEIVECNPPHRLVHTFRFTTYDDPECLVVYDLVETDDGVDFTMTIESIPEGTRTGKQMLQGGPIIVETLKRTCEGRKPSFGVRLLYALFKVTAPLMPKRCRSENWQLDGDWPAAPKA